MSCSQRTARHPSGHVVRQGSVCQITFKLDFKITKLVINIVQFTVLEVNQPLTDKPVKTAFRSSDKTTKTQQHAPSELFQSTVIFVGFSKEYCC